MALNLTGKKGAVVAETTVALLHQVELEQVKREATEQANSVLRSAIAQMERALQVVTSALPAPREDSLTIHHELESTRSGPQRRSSNVQ